MAGKQYAWMDGEFIDYEKATVPILTHSLQYGSGIFEGIRAYSTPKGSAVFRLEEHVHRLFNSMKIYRMGAKFTEKDVQEAILQLLKKNGLKDAYIRPFAFFNDQRIGLTIKDKKVSIAVAAVEFGNYFSNKDTGVKAKVTSWRRINSSILPPEAKASGNYLNSIIASTEAKLTGADEAILLSHDGFISEGPGENIFIVENNRLVTPSRDSDILMGITRASVLKLAESMGIETEERRVNREELYTCDEAFFTGTAAEVTPITEVDSIKVGNGKPGAITKKIGDRFSAIVHGEDKAFKDWLAPVL